jgi:voltage-gated potassium channel
MSDGTHRWTLVDRSRRAELLERFERATDLPLLLLAVVMVPLLLVPLLVEVDSTADTVLSALDWAIWGVFAADLSIRTYLSDRRVQYLRRHWYDVLIVVLPFLRPLRIVRSARLLIALRLLRTVPLAVRIVAEVRRVLRLRGMQYVLLFGLGAVLVCAGLVLYVERESGGAIQDYGTAIWWAVTTITTVGYGDAVPVTWAGRGLAIFLMIVGISLFSWLTANIAAFLVEYGGTDEKSVTLEDVMQKLEALEEEVRSLKAVKEPDLTEVHD